MGISIPNSPASPGAAAANCVELFSRRAAESPSQMALWLPRSGTTSFAELKDLSARAQNLCQKNGVQAGDRVLLVDSLGPTLYASVLGILGLGATVVLVEPWMPVEKIRHIVSMAEPKLFLTNWFGRIWGLRVPEIRAIPHWVSTSEIARHSAANFAAEKVDPGTPGIITFTSGTTGKPKGVVRNQGYLVEQHRVLADALDLEKHQGPDLCIFANFALANLASGRGSVIVPNGWKKSHLRKIDQLSGSLTPQSATCGPAFLLRLMEFGITLPSLESIHVGGALTDCWILEDSFKRWPGAHFTHVYGSSEAEPVAYGDAKFAVSQSREKGYFQTLHLGSPARQIRAQFEGESVWVTGPHVCPGYLGNSEENKIFKRQDSEGNIWHFMGDRIVEEKGSWWYRGRSSQAEEDFQLEQKIYSHLKSSASFIYRMKSGEIILLGEKLLGRSSDLHKHFPEIKKIIELKIYRDKRHRARIDRARTIQKGAKWVLGSSI